MVALFSHRTQRMERMMSECEQGWKIRSTSAFGCGVLISNESTLSFLTVDEAEDILNEHATLQNQLSIARSENQRLTKYADDYEEEIETLKRGVESAHLHLLASICECGEPLRETDAFDVLDTLLTAQEPD